MYGTILISTDGSELATRGVAQGTALARRLGAKLVLVTVTEPWLAPGGIEAARFAVPLDQYEKARAAEAEAIFSATRDAVDLAGVDVRTEHISDSLPAEGIIRAAQQSGADLIVMASHGRRGVGRLLLGSQTNEVLTNTSIPVLVVR